MTTEIKPLHEKLVEVAAQVRNIEKGGRNAAQNYSFVQEADVVRTVYPLLLERGVLFYPTEREVFSIESYPSKSGAMSFLTTIKSKWVATDGFGTIFVASMGQGTDTGGDKGMYKALTGDKKYAVLQLLGIATGDDPEEARQDEVSEGAVRVESKKGMSQSQMNMLMAEAKKAGFDVDDPEGKASLGKSIYEWTNKTNPQHMTNDDLDKVLSALRELQPIVNATGGGVVS